LLWGAQQPEQWAAKGREIDFFDIKGDAETILASTHALNEFSFQSGEHPACSPVSRPRSSARENLWVGLVLYIQNNPGDRYTGKVYLLELDYELIKPSAITAVTELSRFPLIRRDLALIVDQSVTANSIHD
jgi:phenylalanyl-tRNA synthetase beta chain